MIYLDNGATTPVDPAVVDAMLPYYREHFGNPSSLHHLGAAAARGVRLARELFADALGASPEEIIFTGGGTEADSLGVRGLALASPRRRRHALIFALEHPAVREQAGFLESRGFEVETLPCDRDGICDMDALERLLRPDETALVAVMHANNEIGTLQPMEAIGELLADVCPKARLHVDAVQSFSKAPVRPNAWGAHAVALASHKLHGPKGVGLVWVRSGASLQPQQIGGGQEGGRRSGTENVAGIVGFAEASRIALEGMAQDVPRMTALRDHLITRLRTEVDGIDLNGHATHRLCNNANVNVRGARAELLLHALEARGIIVSSGSACHAGQTGPSHVLQAIGLGAEATGTLRITLSRHTTAVEVDACADAIVALVPEARRRATARPA